MDNSTYSGIDQEPNGEPVLRDLAPIVPIWERNTGPAQRAVGSPPPIPLEAAIAATFRRGRLPEAYPGKVAATPSPQEWTKIQTDELDIARMDEEGAAQTPHARDDKGERTRTSTGSSLRSLWNRIWR